MFGKRNVVRPSPRGGKGGRPIQAPMRANRGGGGGRGGRGRVGGRGGQFTSRPMFGSGRGIGAMPKRASGGRKRAVRGGSVKTARRPQYKRR